MPTLNLPHPANLEHLKGQAKALQRKVRAGDPGALETVGAHHPRPGAPGECSAFRLADAQLVVARQYGFPSWPALRRHLEVIARYSRSPARGAAHEAVENAAGALLRLGCLAYGGDDLARHAQARALLAERPELAGSTIHTAAALGDVAATRRFLDADPSLANLEGGPFRWEPLLYLAYSRIDSQAPGHDPVATTRLLLDLGADPNAGYLWDGNYPFTVLTGVLGGGEDKGNQPPHRHCLALARMLLEAGADPNDSQALYNRQFDPDAGHLRLLIEFGLGTGSGGPWHARLRSSNGTPAQLLEDQLSVAASEDRPEWARLALAAGAHPDGRGTLHPTRQGLTPYELALRRGNTEVAEILAAAGAAPPVLDPVEDFLSACLAGNAEATYRFLAADPSLVERAIQRQPAAILQATELGRPGAVRLLASHGFNVNARGRITPLHQAAYDGDVVLIEALLDLGADPDAQDLTFGSTPLGWAEHARQEAAMAILEPLTKRRPTR